MSLLNSIDLLIMEDNKLQALKENLLLFYFILTHLLLTEECSYHISVPITSLRAAGKQPTPHDLLMPCEPAALPSIQCRLVKQQITAERNQPLLCRSILLLLQGICFFQIFKRSTLESLVHQVLTPQLNHIPTSSKVH